MDIRDLTLDEWGELLPEAGIGAFHAPEALAVVDDYATGELRLLGGFRGDQPVGLLPVVVRQEGPLRLVLSPPPGLSVPALGPVLMTTSPKQRKREAVNERFVDGVLDAVDADSHRTLVGMGGTPEYADPRPFAWAGLDVAPRFSYELRLDGTDRDELLDSFTRDLRSEIRKRDDLDLSIGIESPAQAERVCRDLKRRHAEQGLTYPTPPSFSRDLVAALGDRARVYVARDPDGEYLGGITVLYAGDRATFWQGGAKADYESVSVNSLLHWTILEDVLTDPALEPVARYDLGAVDNRRIARYKSKFNPTLAPHYEVKSDLMIAAKGAYSLWRHLGGRLQQLRS